MWPFQNVHRRIGWQLCISDSYQLNEYAKPASKNDAGFCLFDELLLPLASNQNLLPQLLHFLVLPLSPMPKIPKAAILATF